MKDNANNRNKDLILYKEIDKKFNSIFNNINQKLPNANLTNDQLMLFILIQRIKSHYKSINILISSGMYLETLFIIRVIIETSIIMNSLIENPIETIKLLNKNTNYYKFKSHKMAMSNDILKGKAESYNFDVYKNDRVTLDKISNLSNSNKDIYKIGYSQISNKIHLNLLSIESFLDVDLNDNFIIKNQIEFNEFSVYYFTFFYCLYLVCLNLNKKYQLENDLELKIIEKKLELLNH